MAVEVDIQFVADNRKYINGITEMQTAQQGFYAKDKQQKREQIGLIAEVEKRIEKLQAAQKGAMNEDQLKRINRKIAESKMHLAEYNKAGLENIKVTETQTEKFSRLGLTLTKVIGFATAAWAAIKSGKAILESIDTTADKLHETLAGLNEVKITVFSAIASGDFKNLAHNISVAYSSGVEFEGIMDKLREAQIAYSFAVEETATKNAKLKNSLYDINKTAQQKVTIIKEMLLNDKLLEDEQKKLADIEYEATKDLVSKRRQVNKEYLMDFVKQQGLGYQIYLEGAKRIEELERLKGDRILYQGKLVFNAQTEMTTKIQTHEEMVGEAILEAKIKEHERIFGDVMRLSDDIRKTVLTDRQMIQQAEAKVKQAERYADERGMREKRKMETLLNETKRDNEKDQKEREKLEQEDIKRRVEFYTKVEELRNKNTEAEINNLKGDEKINAQEVYEMKSLESLSDYLRTYFGDSIIASEEIERAKLLIQKKYSKERIKLQDQQLSEDLDYYMNELELADANNRDKLQLEIEFLRKQAELADLSGDSITGNKIRQRIRLLKKQIANEWDDMTIGEKMLSGMGFSDEQIEQLIQAGDQIMEVVTQITDKMVDDASRRTDLLNQRIEEEQNALETEQELMKAGFASNVRGKQDEINKLKDLRDKALREEEKARKIQEALNTSTQISNLITASSQIFKSFNEAFPVLGTPLAIAMIGVMIGAFAAAKIQAAKAARLEEGGSGTIHGKRHSQGGENFTDHIEVEDGEAWGVLNRRATQQHGKEFHEIIKAFNKGEMVSIKAKPSIKPTFNISANMSEKRLAQIEREMVKLNNHFSSSGDRTELPDRTIIRKGHTTRVIRKR